jgi:hypothetical protein
MKFNLIVWSLFLTTFFSCTDPDQIGLEIQPEGDKITLSSFSQNPAFTLSSVKGDSVRSDENLLSLFGFYQSSPFGSAKSEFSTQLLLPENEVSFGSNPNLDSAVLSLVYYGYYGDTTIALNISVEQLQDVIELEDTFYSTQLLNSQAFSNPIEAAFYPRPNSLITSETDTIGSALLHLRVDALGQYILDANPDEDLKDNTSFLSYLNGISLRVSQSQSESASICYFNLRDTKTKVTIYYNDSLSYNLTIGSTASRVNHFEVDNNEPFNFIGVHSMGGPTVKILFNDLSSIKDSLQNTVINKALLKFDVVSGYDQNLGPHASLSILRKDDNQTLLFIPDFFEGATHYGGTLENESYEFNISKYLQRLVDEDYPDSALYILPVGNSVNANRTLIEQEVTLTVTYTNF